MNYIPTEQDLKDFEEFSNEKTTRDKLIITKYSAIPLTVDLYSWSCNVPYYSGARQLTKSTVVEYLKTMASVVPMDKVDNHSKKHLLMSLSLFYDDESTVYEEVRNVINDQMTEEEFQYLINDEQPIRPYLNKCWDSVFGMAGLKHYAEMQQRLYKEHVLPYSVFNIDNADLEIEYSQLELIKNQQVCSRPLYYLRSIGLGVSCDELDFYPYATEEEILEVDINDFLNRVLNFNKTLVTAFSWQFGIMFVYESVTNQLRVTIPRLIVLDKLESYFNVRFTGIKQRESNHKLIHIMMINDWMAPSKRSNVGRSTRPCATSIDLPTRTCTEHDEPEVAKCLTYLNRLAGILNGKNRSLVGALEDIGISRTHYPVVRDLLKNPEKVPQKKTAIKLNQLFDELVESSK